MQEVHVILGQVKDRVPCIRPPIGCEILSKQRMQAVTARHSWLECFCSFMDIEEERKWVKFYTGMQCSVTKRFSLISSSITSHDFIGCIKLTICARYYCDDKALSHPSRALWTRKGQSDSERKVELKGTHWKRTQGPPRSERTLH